MSRRLPVAFGLLALALLPAAALAGPARPSDRLCLLAWNAASNRANHVRLLAVRPNRLSLAPGMAGTDTWTKGGVQKSTWGPVCLLTLSKPGKVQVVTGTWRAGHVRRWSFGHPIPTIRPFLGANVRLLADGRVTKIYRH